MQHTHLSSFYWKSSLTDKRKRAIIKWLDGLTKDKQAMIEEIIEDVEADLHFTLTYEG